MEKEIISFSDAFDKYIKGKKVIAFCSIPAYGNSNDPNNHYGSGIVVTGGYKMLHFGGGCSGEDCNIMFIVSPKKKLIAKSEF